MDACHRVVCCLLVVGAAGRCAAQPTCTDDRLVIELVAREPAIVTPTGIAVDDAGRVWVIENNTHERPTSYQGAASDRIRIYDDFDDRGQARRVRTFAEGFHNAMGLALGKDGTVYLATRSDIHLLRDRDGDGVADEQRVLIRLVTTATYPHNGLAGFAFDPLGNLYFALGENRGAEYQLVGPDGATWSGGGEGGSIYRCRPDGTGLVRVATGFWNTFHLTCDAFGRLFAVDNDPDSRGPCRLLHIVQGGDYGYRYRNGRKGLHPFTAWNGELPGTLPMVAGTAEAPSGIVAYESDGLPPEYRGSLFVTSWGDHVVERFEPVPRGASFTAQAQVLVRGGEDFRPVGIATAPDGSLYLSDWVDKSYPVHGKGRIWRIRLRRPNPTERLSPAQVGTLSETRIRQLLAHPRREIRAAAGEALAHKDSRSVLANVLHEHPDSRARIQALWAASQLPRQASLDLLIESLHDSAPEIRGEAARLLGPMFAGEGRLEGKLVEAALHDQSPFVRMQALLQLRGRPALETVVPVLPSKDPFLAGAALATLGRAGNTSLLLRHATSADPRLRLGVLLALRRAGEAEGNALLPSLLADPDPGIRRAAIQWVGEERLRDYTSLLSRSASRPPVTREVFEALLAAQEILANVHRFPSDEPSGEAYISKIVQDPAQPAAFRVLALRMLRPDHPVLTSALLRQFLAGADKDARREAVRTLALRSDESSQELLRQLAGEDKADPALRALAVMGLAHSAPTSQPTQRLLLSLISHPELQRDALRSLRDIPDSNVAHSLLDWWQRSEGTPNQAPPVRSELAAQLLLTLRTRKDADTQNGLKTVAASAEARPHGVTEWRAALAGRGDPASGERVFFQLRGPRCASCHRVDGRGGSVGPDLSRIGSGPGRDKLIESILAPSKEIAPQYQSWLITTRDGRVHTGVIVEEGPNSTLTVADAQGKLEVIHRLAVEERHALPTSLMPDNLHELMTVRDFQDLIAFLSQRQ